MIYSVNFLDMTEKLSPLAVCKYLEDMKWSLFPFKREDIKVFQTSVKDHLVQVRVPLDKDLSDYKESMFDTIQTIAEVEQKSVEQVMLFLLNPNTDILKIRLDKKERVPGNISFDDAIRLYDNAKKLIAATALDVINPKKIHFGRTDDCIQEFLNQCRFGQTEIGSYVVSVVCPFAELSDDNEYKQLSIFSEEDQCADSLTRRVTNKLMDNVTTIKENVDKGNAEYLASEDCDISVNFLEALNGLNLSEENTVLEFTAEWSPVVNKNRTANGNVRVTNDYYQPIEHVIETIRETTNEKSEVIGRIKTLKATPSVDKRKMGTIVIAGIDENMKSKSVSVTLTKEDYDEAVLAHKSGKTVKAVGNLIVSGGKAKMEGAFFSVYD